MATAPNTAPVKQMEALLECSICMETLTEPRTLPCFHSFCKHCLANFVATQKEAVKEGAKVPEVFKCPVCRAKFHVKEGESIEKMPSNHFINNMLELLTLTQQSTKCQSCKARNPASNRCVSCEKYLCEKCLEPHNNWPDFDDHVVLTLEELAKPENRVKARGKPRCEKHDKIFKFYCETCKVLVCRYCVDVDHPRPEHSWLPLADVVVQRKEALKASCAIFEQQKSEAVQSSLKIEHAMATLKNNAAKTKDAIMQQQQEILNIFTKKLEQETAVLFHQVDMKYKKVNKPLMQQQANVKDYLEKAKSSLYFAKNIISYGSDEEILSFKQEVEEKAASIENERPKFMEPVHNGSIDYQATQCEKVLGNVKLNGLGKIVSPLSEEEILKAKQVKDATIQCFYERSKILNGDFDMARQLAEWLKDKMTAVTHHGQWKLCYRATDDGWKAEDFHRKCDDAGPTVTLVKCGICVFGGYTDQSWKPISDPNSFARDPFLVLGCKCSGTSFLFSLRNKDNTGPFICPIYNRQKQEAIFCRLHCGATFGGGYDLHISSDANTNKNSYSILGHTYKPPAEYQQGTPQTKALLAGSKKFTPREIEVFSIYKHKF